MIHFRTYNVNHLTIVHSGRQFHTFFVRYFGYSPLLHVLSILTSVLLQVNYKFQTVHQAQTLTRVPVLLRTQACMTSYPPNLVL